MFKQIILLFTMFFVSFIIFNCSDSTESNAKKFVDNYSKEFQKIFYQASIAQWVANINITDENTQKEIIANKLLSEFEGRKGIIDSVKMYLKDRSKLDFVTLGQLDKILYNASHAPASIPQVVNQLINAEAKQTQALYGYEFKLKDGKKVTANEIDNMLVSEMNLVKRQEIWEASKEIGKSLKDGLSNLQGLRNKVAREMGYSSYFDLEISLYGMKAAETKDWMQKVNSQLKPLYEQLYTWVKYKLAERYHAPLPDKIPAHWLPNRWAQEWPGIVEGINLDNMFKGKSSEWIVKQGEKFYISMGMPHLPQSFWDKSDLYSLPADSPRKKNTNASAWHLDLDKDIRSLMNVESNAEWFQTVHHELGHTYYFIAYTNPNVQLLLRDGLNPAYYYNYAVAKLIQYQLHNYISKNILKQNPHYANYYNSKETGQYLLNILEKGKTVDWRSFIKEKTGEELSANGMLEYFRPLMDWLKKENAGRKIGW